MDKLENAIKEQLGCEDMQEFKQTLADVCRGGGNAGWSGFTYSSELLEFWQANRPLIMEALKDMASDMGVGMLEMVQGFNCLKDTGLTVDEIGEIIFSNNSDHECATMVIDSLCWFALETVAFRYDS